MADSWEDYDDQETIAVAQGAYDTNEGADDVIDSWEDELDDDKPTAPVVKAPPKKTLDQKIADRNAIEEKKARDMAAKKAVDAETPAQRKARMEQAQIESDMAHSADLFAGATVVDPAAVKLAADIASGDNVLDKMVPVKKAEFETYSKALVERILSFKPKDSLYVPFLEKLVRELADPLDFSDIRKLSSMLSTLSNEKQRSEKDKKSGKKSAATKKAQVKVSNDDGYGGASAGADDYDMDDDFM